MTRFLSTSLLVTLLSAAGASLSHAQAPAAGTADPAAQIPSKPIDIFRKEYNSLHRWGYWKAAEGAVRCKPEQDLDCEVAIGEKAMLKTYFSSPQSFVVEVDAQSTLVILEAFKIIDKVRSPDGFTKLYPPIAMMGRMLQGEPWEAFTGSGQWTISYGRNGNVILRNVIATCASHRLCDSDMAGEKKDPQNKLSVTTLADVFVTRYNRMSQKAQAKAEIKSCANNSCEIQLGNSATLKTYYSSPLEYVAELETKEMDIVPIFLSATGPYSKENHQFAKLMESILRQDSLSSSYPAGQGEIGGDIGVGWSVMHIKDHLLLRLYYPTCAKYELCERFD